MKSDEMVAVVVEKVQGNVEKVWKYCGLAGWMLRRIIYNL